MCWIFPAVRYMTYWALRIAVFQRNRMCDRLERRDKKRGCILCHSRRWPSPATGWRACGASLDLHVSISPTQSFEHTLGPQQQSARKILQDKYYGAVYSCHLRSTDLLLVCFTSAHTSIMRLKHELQPACLRHLIHLQMEDAGWVSPAKADPQVSMPGSWKTGFILSAFSKRVTGLWPLSCVLRGAGVLPGIFHGKLPLFHVGERGCVVWEHLSAGYLAVKCSGWIVVSRLKCVWLPVPSQCQVLSEVPSDGEPCSAPLLGYELQPWTKWGFSL